MRVSTLSLHECTVVSVLLLLLLCVHKCAVLAGQGEGGGWGGERCRHAELQRVRSGWCHALCSHIHAQADINIKMYLPGGIFSQLVASSWWWNIGLTGLNCSAAHFLLECQFMLESAVARTIITVPKVIMHKVQ